MRRTWPAILLLTVFLQLLGFGIVLPLLPYYGRSFGAGGAAIGALFAIYSLTQFLLAPVWGGLADRFGRRPVILASVAGGFAAYVMFATAETYFVLLLSRFLAGLSAAVIGVSQAYLVDRTAPDERARGMGMLGAALGLGFVVGPAIGAFLGRWGFAAPGYLAAALTAGNFVLALKWLPESLPSERRRASARATPPLPRLGSLAPGLAGVFAILFLTTASFSVLYPVIPLFVDERFGFGPMQAGILFSFIGLVATGVQGGALGWLARRIGEKPLLRAGPAAMATGLILLPLCRTEVELVLTLVPMALGFAVTTPIAQTLLSWFSPASEQAVNLGLGQSTASLARAVGPLAGGFLYEHVGQPSPFWAAAVLLIGAFGLVWALPTVQPPARSRAAIPVVNPEAAVLSPEPGGAPTRLRP